jgi:hypothetical protein
MTPNLVAEGAPRTPSLPAIDVGIEPPVPVAHRFGGSAHRRREPALTRAGVAHLGGAVVVRVSPAVLELATPAATAGEVHERIRRWWRLGPHLAGWARLPGHAPRLLLGVTGADDDLRVLGALRLDPSGWRRTAAARRPFGLYELPTVGDPARATGAMLDHLGLRDRRLVGGQFGARLPGGGRAFAGGPAHAVDVIP